MKSINNTNLTNEVDCKSSFLFQHFYIFNANDQMCSDDGYLEDAKKLQDEVCTIITKEMTNFLIKHRGEAK